MHLGPRTPGIGARDAKAEARVEGELTGIRLHWAEIAREKEKNHTRLLKMGEQMYAKAE